MLRSINKGTKIESTPITAEERQTLITGVNGSYTNVQFSTGHPDKATVSNADLTVEIEKSRTVDPGFEDQDYFIITVYKNGVVFKKKIFKSNMKEVVEYLKKLAMETRVEKLKNKFKPNNPWSKP